MREEVNGAVSQQDCSHEDEHERYASYSPYGSSPRKHPCDVPLIGDDLQIHQK